MKIEIFNTGYYLTEIFSLGLRKKKNVENRCSRTNEHYNSIAIGFYIMYFTV